MATSHAAEFERVIRSGGVVLFPSDTVYGLACDPDNDAAVRRLYAIKRRPAEKPSARMFFELESALTAIDSETTLGPNISAAVRALLPGPATLILPGGLGLRVVDVPALRGVTLAVLQSSANLSGEPDARAIDEVNKAVSDAVDLQIDGGNLPGTASTVIDLRDYEYARSWTILRHGAIPAERVAAMLDP